MLHKVKVGGQMTSAEVLRGSRNGHRASSFGQSACRRPSHLPFFDIARPSRTRPVADCRHVAAETSVTATPTCLSTLYTQTAHAGAWRAANERMGCRRGGRGSTEDSVGRAGGQDQVGRTAEHVGRA